MLINPAEGLSYSSAVAETTSSQELKDVALTEGVVVSTNAVSKNEEAPVQSAGLAAPSFNVTSVSEAENQARVISAGLASPAALEALDPGGSAAELTAAQLTRYGCDTSHSDKFCVYEVQEGDTLSTIAQQFGLETTEDVASWELLVHSNKPDIVSEDDILQIGQNIRIPRGNGVIHTVLTAETLSDISARYDVPMEDIINENGIGDADTLNIGDELLIPNPKQFVAPPSAGDAGLADEGFEPEPQPEIVGGGSTSGYGFIWPVTGPITSYFSAGHPLGIDIDLYNGGNPPIAAAKGGTVSFAGGNPCCSYGYYVVVDHGDGFQTLYAHLSSIAVSQGQFVAQGELIGYGGTTGYSTGDHLHFEVHQGGGIVNPLAYLP